MNIFWCGLNPKTPDSPRPAFHQFYQPWVCDGAGAAGWVLTPEVTLWHRAAHEPGMLLPKPRGSGTGKLPAQELRMDGFGCWGRLEVPGKGSLLNIWFFYRGVAPFVCLEKCPFRSCWGLIKSSWLMRGSLCHCRCWTPPAQLHEPQPLQDAQGMKQECSAGLVPNSAPAHFPRLWPGHSAAPLTRSAGIANRRYERNRSQVLDLTSLVPGALQWVQHCSLSCARLNHPNWACSHCWSCGVSGGLCSTSQSSDLANVPSAAALWSFPNTYNPIAWSRCW